MDDRCDITQLKAKHIYICKRYMGDTLELFDKLPNKEGRLSGIKKMNINNKCIMPLHDGTASIEYSRLPSLYLLEVLGVLEEFHGWMASFKDMTYFIEVKPEEGK